MTGLTGTGATGVEHLLEESGLGREWGILLGDTGGDGRLLLLKNGFFEYGLKGSDLLHSIVGLARAFGVVLRLGVEVSDELAVGVRAPSRADDDDDDEVLGDSERGHPWSCKSSIEE